MDTIIDHSNPQDPVTDYFFGDDLLSPLVRRRGLPIGNLTSQCFANIYLNGLDHLIKETLKVKKYLRYADDFALFSDDRNFLIECRSAIETYLTSLRLRIHPIKSQIFATQQGANFVGFRVLPEQIRIRRSSLKQSRRRLRRLHHRYQLGQVSISTLTQSICSWLSHLDHGDTWLLRKYILSELCFLRS